jgi:hypothetical protein
MKFHISHPRVRAHPPPPPPKRADSLCLAAGKSENAPSVSVEN